MNKVVLDYRYKNHSLVAETNEPVFVYDEARDKVTRWLVKASTLQRDSGWIELCDCVRRWPELNPLRHSATINRLKLHVQACYSVIGSSHSCGTERRAEAVANLFDYCESVS